MALTGWSGSNKLRKTSAIVADPGSPVTFVSWGYMGTVQTGVAIGIFASASNSDDDYHELLVRPSPFQVSMRSASGSTGNAAQSANFPANTWTHMGGWVASAASRAAYVNGANKVTDTGSRTPVGLDRTAMGVRDNVSNDTPWPSAGHLGPTAVWNVALSDNDMAALGAGLDPLLVHPESLILCNYLDAPGGPDLVSATPFSMIGTLTQSTIGPPMFRAS